MNTREEAVIAAAEQLLARTGTVPTVEAVREALGGGSFSTISPVLREWRNQHRTAHSATVEVPPRIRESMERTTAALWSAFHEEIEERIAHAQEAAQARATEAEEEREQALKEVARLEAGLAQTAAKAETEREGLRVERDEARQSLAIAREEIATLKERTRQLETQAEDLRKERAGFMDELRAQVRALQGKQGEATNQNRTQAPARNRTAKGRDKKPDGGKTDAS